MNIFIKEQIEAPLSVIQLIFKLINFKSLELIYVNKNNYQILFSVIHLI